MRRKGPEEPVTPNRRRRARRDASKSALPAGVEHGDGYWHGCRCDECTDGNSLRRRQWEHRKRGELPPQPPRSLAGRTHGRIATYNDGCRCDECRIAARDYRARQRAKARQEDRRRLLEPGEECVFCGEWFPWGPKGGAGFFMHENACQRRRAS